MKQEKLLEEGRITNVAIDLLSNERVSIISADFERKIVLIKDQDGTERRNENEKK